MKRLHGAAALGLLALPVWSQGQLTTSSERVQEILAQVAVDPTLRPSQAAALIFRLGSDGLGPLVQSYRDGVQLADGALLGAAELRLQREAVVLTLRRHSATAVSRELYADGLDGEDLSSWQLAVDLTAEVRQRALFEEFLYQAVQSRNAYAFEAPAIQQSVRGMVLQQLEDDQWVGFHLSTIGGDLPQTLQEIVVDGLAQAAGPESLAALQSLLGQRDDLDIRILDGLARRETLSLDEREESIQAGRRYLAYAEPELVRAASRVLANTRDMDSVEDLIFLLGHGDRRVRVASHEALGQILGVSFAPVQEDWSRWYAEEQSWWNREGEEVLDLLHSPRTASVVAGLRQAGEHPIHRERLSPHVSDLLHDPRDQIVKFACVCLGTLGDTSRARDLLGVMERHNRDGDAVRHAAWVALGRLTGWDLPADPQGWHNRL